MLEQRGRLPASHREIRRPQLQQPALRAQAADRERRLAARSQRQLRSGRDVLGERRQRRERAGGLEDLDAVEG